MTAAALLEEARRLGLRLSIRGDKLLVEPEPAPAIVEQLRAHKAELLAHLRRRLSPADIQKAAREACQSLPGYVTPTALLAKLAPDELAELRGMADPVPYLRSFAAALVWTTMRKQGIAPPGWTHTAHCDRCGPVYLWATLKVAGCPWCWNRLHQLPIPRPPKKTAAPIGSGAEIGTEARLAHGGKTLLQRPPRHAGTL